MKNRPLFKIIEPIYNFLTEANRYPKLTVEEEIELAKKMAEKGLDAAAAREKLINCNLHLVISISFEYDGCGIPIVDRFQIGNLALIRAVDRFDYTYGYRLSSFASQWIQGAINRAIREEHLIRLPEKFMREYYLIMNTQNNFRIMHGHEPNITEISEKTGIEPNRITKILQLAAKTYSYDTDAENTEPIINNIRDPTAVDPYEAVEQYLTKEAILEILKKLTPLESTIIKLHFGLGNIAPLSFTEIAKQMHVSRQYIQQINVHAIKKLKYYAAKSKKFDS